MPMPVKTRTPRTALLQRAKDLAKDIQDGRLSGSLRGLGPVLSGTPDAVAILVDLLQAKFRKTRPRAALMDALLMMIGEALAEARMAIEADPHGPAVAVVEGVRTGLVAQAEAGRMPPELLMAVVRQFSAAKLDPGDPLRALMVALSEAAAEAAGPIDLADMAAQYEALAEAFGNDPFLIHGQLSEQLSAYPDDHRGPIVESLVFSTVPAMRDAALGWLLDPNPAVGRSVAQALATAAARGLVSAESADRMVLMRPWLPEAVQASADTAVRACRQRGEAPPARAAAQAGTVMVTGCDGAGAQSVFVLVKRGRTLALASLLVKHGFGLRDAFVQEGLGKRELDGLIGAIVAELDPFDASPEIVRTAIAHGLAVALARGEALPFGLVQFLGTVGLTQVRPERLDPEALLAEFLAAMPEERRSDTAVAAALADSKTWPKRYGFLNSWFEQDDAVHAVARGPGSRKQKEAALLDGLLSARRGQWAERLAWTAKAAQDQVEEEAWIGFALVARELLGARPLAEIPLAAWIARNTLAAANGR